MVPHSLCNKLTVIFAIVGLSFEFILGTCIERDEQIQKYLTSDNYFNISKAVYPSVDLPSLLINISVVFLETAGEKSNGSNSLSTLKRNVSRSTLHFTWSMSCLYVSGGEISLESMKWFSLGAIFPNRRKRELHITLPELCRDSPVDINKTMEYFLSTVNDHSELSNVFLSRFSFVVLTFSKESEGGGTGGKGRRWVGLTLSSYPPPNYFSSRSPLRPFDWKACSQANEGTRTLSLDSLPCRPVGRPHYVFVVNNCWHETNKIYEGNELFGGR